MKILEYPDERLRIKTHAVDKVTPELTTIAHEMYKIMRAANGIGLAANQVGLEISLLVLENNGKPLIMFNPVILHKVPDQIYGPEGCLSFINTIRIIKRPKQITVKYRDEHNKMRYIILKNIQARAATHEIDHLKGILFIDYAEKI